MHDAPEFLRPREYHREGAAVRLWRFLRRNTHVTIPLLVPWLMLAAGQALAHRHYSRVTEYVAAVAACAVMWFAADRKWDTGPRLPRKRSVEKRWRWTSEVAYARASVIGASGWLLLAARYGPLTRPLEWALGAFCAAWGWLYWQHKRPRGKRARKRHAAEVARWDAWWQSHAHAFGAPGSAVLDAVTTEAVDSLLIQLVKGRQSYDTLKGQARLIESALDGHVHYGMIRLERVKENGSQVWLHLKREDPLREEIGLDESMLPDDITQAVPLGVRESGGWFTAVLRRGWFIIGKTRRGKSNQLSVMFAAITRCRNARLWLIDMKGGRSMRPWLAAVDWPAVTIGEARLLLGCAVAEERARGTYAYGGTEQLEPTGDVPALFAAIDETHGVTSETAGDAQCAASLAIIAGEGSGLEVYPVVSTQYGALAESVRTNQTRMNLDGRMCFQVDDPEDGTFALGDDARNSADPTKLREKGQFFCRLNAETSPEQIRGPLIEHDKVRLIAARNAWTTRLHERPLRLYCGNQPCPLMPGRTWQQVYDERWSRLPAAFHADAPQAVTVNPSPAAESQVPTKISNSYPPEVTEQVARINDEVDELPVTSADIERARQLRAARGAEPVSLQCEFDERRRKFAALLDAAPPEGIAPRMLEQGSGFSREWVRRLLNALVDGNAVEKAGPGRYRPLMPAWEALEILRESNDKLAAEARQMAGV